VEEDYLGRYEALHYHLLSCCYLGVQLNGHESRTPEGEHFLAALQVCEEASRRRADSEVGVGDVRVEERERELWGAFSTIVLHPRFTQSMVSLQAPEVSLGQLRALLARSLHVGTPSSSLLQAQLDLVSRAVQYTEAAEDPAEPLIQLLEELHARHQRAALMQEQEAAPPLQERSEAASLSFQVAASENPKEHSTQDDSIEAEGGGGGGHPSPSSPFVTGLFGDRDLALSLRRSNAAERAQQRVQELHSAAQSLASFGFSSVRHVPQHAPVRPGRAVGARRRGHRALVKHPCQAKVQR